MKEQTSNTNPEFSAAFLTPSPLQLKRESIQEMSAAELESIWGGGDHPSHLIHNPARPSLDP